MSWILRDLVSRNASNDPVLEVPCGIATFVAESDFASVLISLQKFEFKLLRHCMMRYDGFEKSFLNWTQK